jgi:uncharacterized membrane protein YadS
MAERRGEAHHLAGRGLGTLETRFAPWFILAFLAFATARSIGLLPDALVMQASRLASLLSIISMAALGLGVDMRSVTAAGPRVIAVVSVSLLILGSVALIVIRLASLA